VSSPAGRRSHLGLGRLRATRNDLLLGDVDLPAERGQEASSRWPSQ
jgi:hypothetical protein